MNFKNNVNPKDSLKKLKEISSIITEEMNIIKKAIEIEKEKGEVILKAKTSRLQELTNRSNELLNSLIEIENTRYTLIGELIEKYKNRLSSTQINITNFLSAIREIKNDSNNNDQWEKTIDNLIINLKEFKYSTEQLKSEVETNQKLLTRTKTIISDILDKIEKKDKTYLKNKKIKAGNSLLINQSI